MFNFFLCVKLPNAFSKRFCPDFNFGSSNRKKQALFLILALVRVNGKKKNELTHGDVRGTELAGRK